MTVEAAILAKIDAEGPCSETGLLREVVIQATEPETENDVKLRDHAAAALQRLVEFGVLVTDIDPEHGRVFDRPSSAPWR